MLGLEPRSPHHATSWLSRTERFSQLGGHPTWIQDAYYSRCPDCSQRMMFVGQVSNDDVQELAEGIYYAYACDRCQVSATSYQQS
jgi:DNA-directed RNA polymerase subunit RPC12/RpoP